MAMEGSWCQKPSQLTLSISAGSSAGCGEARPPSCAVLCHAQICRAQLLSPRHIRQLQNGIGRSCLSAWPNDAGWHSRKGRLANSCWSNLLLTNSCLLLALLPALEMGWRIAVGFSQCSWEGQEWQVQKSPFAAWSYPGRARGVRRSWTWPVMLCLYSTKTLWLWVLFK